MSAHRGPWFLDLAEEWLQVKSEDVPVLVFKSVHLSTLTISELACSEFSRVCSCNVLTDMKGRWKPFYPSAPVPVPLTFLFLAPLFLPSAGD